MKELTVEQYIKEIDSYFKALRQVPRGIQTMIRAGQSVQTDDQAERTHVFQINEALKYLEKTALSEMVNLSESLRALERLRHEPQEPKADPEITDPNVDLPEV